MTEGVASPRAGAVAELLPSEGPAGPLPVLREQAERLFGALVEKGDRETFLRLNPLLALLVEATAKGRRAGTDSPGTILCLSWPFL